MSLGLYQLSLVVFIRKESAYYFLSGEGKGFTHRVLEEPVHQPFPPVLKKVKMVQGPLCLQSKQGFKSLVGWGTFEMFLSLEFLPWEKEHHTHFTILQGSKEEWEHSLEKAL